mmetsp:Transcript_33370/g.33621  ORF Transcript_33370/g.33621 Transcript_33370/m.33621 type:complete len:85 (-) Transcript_33370:344-598(-)
MSCLLISAFKSSSHFYSSLQQPSLVTEHKRNSSESDVIHAENADAFVRSTKTAIATLAGTWWDDGDEASRQPASKSTKSSTSWE